MTIEGGGGADKIKGGSSRDILYGEGGRDKVKGGDGKDIIEVGRAARTRSRCGAGNDKVVADSTDKIAGDCEKLTIEVDAT